MRRKTSETLFHIGTVVKTLGSMGVLACSVALVVSLVQVGNVAAALAVGTVLCAVLAYYGGYVERMSTLSWIAGDDDGDN